MYYSGIIVIIITINWKLLKDKYCSNKEILFFTFLHQWTTWNLFIKRFKNDLFFKCNFSIINYQNYEPFQYTEIYACIKLWITWMFVYIIIPHSYLVSGHMDGPGWDCTCTCLWPSFMVYQYHATFRSKSIYWKLLLSQMEKVKKVISFKFP